MKLIWITFGLVINSQLTNQIVYKQLNVLSVSNTHFGEKWE